MVRFHIILMCLLYKTIIISYACQEICIWQNTDLQHITWPLALSNSHPKQMYLNFLNFFNSQKTCFLLFSSQPTYHDLNCYRLVFSEYKFYKWHSVGCPKMPKCVCFTHTETLTESGVLFLSIQFKRKRRMIQNQCGHIHIH